jgi:hypothetical protein
MPDKQPPSRRSWHFWRGGKEGARSSSRLTDEQLVILGLLLVVLLAVSMLYCLGFASLAVRDNWQRAPLPWSETTPADEIPEGILTMEPEDGATPP